MGETLGFNLVNFIVPIEPTDLTIIGKNGDWTIRLHSNYSINRQTINSRVNAAITYIADHEDLGFIKDEEVLVELTNLCLTFSYLTSNAVTIKCSTNYSRVSFVQIGDGFPRDRGISGIDPIIVNQLDFISVANLMLLLFNQNKTDYHIDVIIHYWLDILSCWSLENLFLGACTILEIIKQCERRRLGKPNLYFYDAIASTSRNLKISVLNRDWINMRNDLIHEGHLSKVKNPNKSKSDCIEICEDLMLWIDQFIHAIFNLGSIKYNRFDRGSLEQLNSYTVWT